MDPTPAYHICNRKKNTQPQSKKQILLQWLECDLRLLQNVSVEVMLLFIFENNSQLFRESKIAKEYISFLFHHLYIY